MAKCLFCIQSDKCHLATCSAYVAYLLNFFCSFFVTVWHIYLAGPTLQMFHDFSLTDSQSFRPGVFSGQVKFVK